LPTGAAASIAIIPGDDTEQLVGLLIVQQSNGRLMRDFENAVVQAIVE